MGRTNKLKKFTRQYNHKYIGGYLYIECPRPQFKMLESAKWEPKVEDLDIVSAEIRECGLFDSYSFFYSKKDAAYYVIDHLWVATLTAWGNEEMQGYMRDVLNRMVSKVWNEKVIVAKAAEDKFALVVDVVDDNLESVKNKGPQTSKKEPKQLSLLKEEVKEEDFLEKYGISRKVYDNMLPDAHLIDASKNVPILEICKFLYNAEQIKMKDIYDIMKKLKIITQPNRSAGGKFNIVLLSDWITKKYGFMVKKKSTEYPTLYPSGVVMLGMILHEQGLTKKYILPSL